MIYQLDEIDFKILELLQEDGKMANIDLAKKIGLSPAATLERVRKLETAYIIQGYHAKLNPDKLGLNFRAYVLVALNNHSKDAIDHFIEKTKKITAIVECYQTAGGLDFILKIITKDKDTYLKAVLSSLTQFENIEKIQTLIIFSENKEGKIVP